MGEVCQIVVEGASDAIMIKRLIGTMVEDALDWKGKETGKGGFWHCRLPNGCTLCLRVLGGYQRLTSVGAELHRAKELDDCRISMNLLVLDADTPATGGGHAQRKQWVQDTVQAFQNPPNVDVFLLPNNASDGTLETLLLSARAREVQRVDGCLDAFTQCLAHNQAPYPLEDKMVFSLYAWLFDKTAATRLRVDSAIKNEAIVDFDSHAFMPLRAFLQRHLRLDGAAETTGESGEP